MELSDAENERIDLGIHRVLNYLKNIHVTDGLTWGCQISPGLWCPFRARDEYETLLHSKDYAADNDEKKNDTTGDEAVRKRIRFHHFTLGKHKAIPCI